jgi:hypothetical protein
MFKGSVWKRIKESGGFVQVCCETGKPRGGNKFEINYEV